MTLLEDAEVLSSDGKSARRIVGVNAQYFISRKVGFVLDEEYRIPLDAISYIELAKGDIIVVRLPLMKYNSKIAMNL